MRVTCSPHLNVLHFITLSIHISAHSKSLFLHHRLDCYHITCSTLRHKNYHFYLIISGIKTIAVHRGYPLCLTAKIAKWYWATRTWVQSTIWNADNDCFILTIQHYIRHGVVVSIFASYLRDHRFQLGPQRHYPDWGSSYFYSIQPDECLDSIWDTPQKNLYTSLSFYNSQLSYHIMLYTLLGLQASLNKQSTQRKY